MPAEQREVDRKDLANLQAKVKYLRNPRCGPKSASTQTQALVKVHKQRPKAIGIENKGPEPKSV